MENKREVCSPFIPRRNPLRKTSAEIVREARQSLRVQSTHRPFTPSDGQRHLFGRNSIRVERDNRPPSAFSLHSQNFDAPDSRPGSGIRLSPLGHKPKFPVLCNAEDPLKAFPKPPSAPAEGRKGQTRARARLLKAASVSTLSPVEGHKEGEDGKQMKKTRKKPFSKLYASPKKKLCFTKMPITEDTLQAIQLQNVERKAHSIDLITRISSQCMCFASFPGVSEGSVDRLCDLCDRLHGALAEADMLGRRCKRRSGILRALFRLIDLNSVQLNLHVAKLCLALCVSENNLLNICKLVFQISRTFDCFTFLNMVISRLYLISFIVREEVSSSGEALLYCVGTLKFLSGNSVLLRLLLEKNCIGVTQKLLQKLCAVEDTLLTISGHILVQLTATLRNLADHPDSRPLFVSFSILSLLCTVLRQHCEDQDICTNISRIFSKLSSYSECRLALAQTPDCYQLFLELLSKHHQKQDLVVRLLFTLGNLAAKSDEPRQQLFQCDGCVDTLIQLYRHYQQREAPVQKDGLSRRGAPARAASAQEAEDVLVKLVRLLANMCIHPTVGPSLAADAACVQLLMETLELRSAQESEELLVNVAATINNLSFYKEEQLQGILNCANLSPHLFSVMLKLMLSSSPEAMLEATRVYGNLSQAKNVRDFMMQNKVHLFMVALLDSKSTDVCFSACGVLINLAVDPPSRACLSQEGAAAKLVDCLRDLGPGDWQLAGRVCQALWNLTGSGSGDVLDPQNTLSFILLKTYRSSLTAFCPFFSTGSVDEEEAVKWIESEDARGQHKACWETHFLPVAQKLMKLLQTADSIP
uniref:Armadillo repeat containing 2 n=1 Tax=Salarias fasciatus TaxID=181472 RepID=A0A672H7K9_SALFA